MKYFIVDVFCKDKYSGNQLAVVLSSNSLQEKDMQIIAREFNFSETTFVFEKDTIDTTYRVRIFTPQKELPFAGHPTLGTAFIIRNELDDRNTKRVVLNLNAGKIPVTFEDDTGIQWMRQNEPEFGLKHNYDKIAELINVANEEIDTRFPVQNVSTGIEFLIIPLKSLNAVRNATINSNNYNEYFRKSNPLPIFIFCPETYERNNTLNSRMFADIFGIPEDPATGSANGCLAAYLAHYKYFGLNNVDISIEQGYEIGRKSILHIRSELDNGQYNVYVGGNVIKIAEGILL